MHKKYLILKKWDVCHILISDLKNWIHSLTQCITVTTISITCNDCIQTIWIPQMQQQSSEKYRDTEVPK